MASSMTASASNTNFYGNIPSLTEELGTRMVPKINTIYGKTPSDLRIKIKGMLSTYKFDTSNKVHLTNGNKNIVIGFSRTFVAKD